MGHSLDQLKDKTNVADTCIATLALMRAGSSPSAGAYAKNVRSAILYICSEVEESDKTSLYVTNIRGTRVQMKLGPYIDTFLASMLLADVNGQMPDPKSQKRVELAFHKVMDKIEKNQKADGTWDGQGWAPVLSQAMASKAINHAAQRGLKVNEKVRVRAEQFARGQFDAKSGSFGMAGGGTAIGGRGGLGKGSGGAGGFGGGSGGAAGVQFYAAASSLGSIQDSENTNALAEGVAHDKLKKAKTETERKAAQTTVDRIVENRATLRQAQGAVIGKMNDQAFMNGFGSNGGEEFLSYMNIGESLVTKGGKEWKMDLPRIDRQVVLW